MARRALASAADAAAAAADDDEEDADDAEAPAELETVDEEEAAVCAGSVPSASPLPDASGLRAGRGDSRRKPELFGSLLPSTSVIATSSLSFLPSCAELLLLLVLLLLLARLGPRFSCGDQKPGSGCVSEKLRSGVRGGNLGDDDDDDDADA